jgi:hypothetical protein
MALPDSLNAELNSLVTAAWSQIMADAAANNGVTNFTLSVKITDDPVGGPLAYEIGFSHRYRTEVSQSQYQKVTGIAS